MTIYLVQLRQAQGGGTWPNKFKYSNVFYTNQASAEEAASVGQAIWEALRPAYHQAAYCSSIYATDLVEGTTDYWQEAVPLGVQRGTFLPGGDPKPYHPEICLRVDLPVASSRPSRKFIRGGFTDDDVGDTGMAFAGAVATRYGTAFSNVLAIADAALCDVDGQPLTGYIVVGLTTHDLGREAFSDVPTPPPFG